MEIDLFHEKLDALKAKSKRENHGNAGTDAAIVKLEKEIDQKIAHRAETSYSRFFEMLSIERTRSSQDQREEALRGIAQRLSSKYAPELYKVYDLEILHKAIVAGRSEEEITLAMRAYILEALLNVEQSFDFICATTLPAINKMMLDEGASQTRAALVTGYAVLQYFIHVDNGGFGLDEKIEEVLGITTEAAAAKDSLLTTSGMLAIGLMLAATVNRNFAIKESIPDVVELLKDDDIDVRKTAGKLIALMFELYDFSEQGNGTTNEQEFDGFAYTIPSIENDYLVTQLTDLINDQAKSVPKREKSDHRSVFRKALITAEVRLQPLGPRQADHEQLTGDEVASGVISHLHFSPSKALPILSWHELLLTTALKWVYGEGLHTQIANNELITDAVVEASQEALRLADNDFVASGAATPRFGADAPDTLNTAKLMDKHISRSRDLKNRALMSEDY